MTLAAFLLITGSALAGQAAVQSGDAAKAREWLQRAEAYAGESKPDSARAAVEEAEGFAGDDPQIFQDLANFYAVRLRDYPKAAAWGARYAERSPRDTTAWRRLAGFCLSAGLPDQAIAAGLRALSISADADLYKLMGTAYAQRKEWTEASRQFGKAVELNRYDEDAHFRLAQVHLFQQDFAAATSVLENARKIFDKSPQIELALGVAHYGARDFGKAVDQFLKAAKLAPDVPQPYLFLGRILENAHDRFPEAIELFKGFESRNPGSHLGFLLHAKALTLQLPPAEFTGEAQKALDLTRKALALKEDDAEAHMQAGILLDRKQEYPEAAVHLERSAKLNPRDPAVHYRLARVYDRLGRKEEAARERAEHAKLNEQIQTGGSMDPLMTPPTGSQK